MKFIVWYLDNETRCNSLEKIFFWIEKLVDDLWGEGLDLGARKSKLSTLIHAKSDQEIQTVGRFKSDGIWPHVNVPFKFTRPIIHSARILL